MTGMEGWSDFVVQPFRREGEAPRERLPPKAPNHRFHGQPERLLRGLIFNLADNAHHNMNHKVKGYQDKPERDNQLWPPQRYGTDQRCVA